jgi:glycosyltransferase involved in cell wall biosynthesis
MKFKLVIYGKVIDPIYFQEITDYVHKKGLSECITFIHDEIHVQQQLAKYRFGLHTALSESGPLVLIEFLAQGLPFLAFETGQVASTIINDLPDSFVANFNLDDWEVHLEKVFRLDQRCLFEVYKKYFDPQEYLVKCNNIYEEIFSG